MTMLSLAEPRLPDLEGRAVRRTNPLALLPALGLHALLLLALALVMRERVNPPAPPAVSVELISAEAFRVATAPMLATPPAPVVDPVETPPAQIPPEDGMTHATTLYSATILRDPANREVAQTLPLLAREERMTQLCNIEALEQLRSPDAAPDSLAASAFADTVVTGLTLVADGGAYRSARLWYGVQFTCTIAPDFSAVTDFSFRTGDAIPQVEWEAHDLIAADDEE